ncbi:MltA domain-containing protein [Flocculibacter collagenilyticus]|uniref:MltA domain-containing protein n=1 Tax=Flocculibacter collagenilyticus TaxID=2744479 RepID=UPI0018F6242A|nr:MltA domain-containing protein [Flocculibacter collagenilyticus]
MRLTRLTALYALCSLLLSFFTCQLANASEANQANTLNAHATFMAEPITASHIGQMAPAKTSHLCNVAEQTQQYLASGKTFDAFANHKGEVFDSSVTFERVTQTLAYICEVYRDDVRNKRQSRLQDPDFLAANFEFMRWQPDLQKAQQYADNSKNDKKSRLLRNIPTQSILLTKYYTKLLNASEQPTAVFNQALYQLPDDEYGLTKEQALAKKHELTRFKFTRQQIIQGALRKQNLAKPLIWLSEDSLHDVLLQGTGVINTAAGMRYFNVHRNNGIAYDYTLGKREQPRYWYFAEVPSILGYGKSLQHKIKVQPHVTFAGNVKQLGLGKLMMVQYQQKDTEGKSQSVSRLGILADQGGAFDDNLFQLDMLVDSYYGWQDYYQANKHIADYAQAWLLLKK